MSAFQLGVVVPLCFIAFCHAVTLLRSLVGKG